MYNRGCEIIPSNFILFAFIRKSLSATPKTANIISINLKSLKVKAHFRIFYKKILSRPNYQILNLNSQILHYQISTLSNHQIASSNSPSLFAITTAAKQLPITFTEVLAISIIASMPKIIYTGHSGM